MNRENRATAQVLLLLVITWGPLALADDFTIDWWTIDSGGEIWSTGGDFELGGTIGQPDAGTMTGGAFELTGGSWATPPCWCMSDVNNDGLRNGLDVQEFIACLLVGGAGCACADLYADGLLDLNDMTVFVSDLLAGGECP
jgi:hypothetical protein